MRYLVGQLLLYKASASRVRIARPKDGFYIVIKFDGLKLLMCPVKPDEEDYISLCVVDGFYPLSKITTTNRNLLPSCMNFLRKIDKSLIPKNIKL